VIGHDFEAMSWSALTCEIRRGRTKEARGKEEGRGRRNEWREEGERRGRGGEKKGKTGEGKRR